MKRRHGLLAATGAAALAAGLGWRLRDETRGAAPLDEATGGFWQARFERPGGGGEIVTANYLGQPLLLNFWATWCPPCIKEMPELDRFQREFAGRGWRVLGLAVDRLQPVLDFLARQPVGYDIGMAGLDGSDLSRRLGNDAGGLPFTALFDKAGRIVQRKLGETNFDELSRWAKKI